MGRLPGPRSRPLLALAAVTALIATLAAPATSALPLEDAEALGLYFSEDQLVESPTRNPKPLSQVAENVTVVTAQEIEAMNAHTLAEVLNRVTGVFVELFGIHFGANALPHIQGSGETDFAAGKGSQERHVLVLVDSVPWSTQGGNPSLHTIPLGIVDRIEIIQGPASSTWGPALAGVIHVFTKGPVRGDRPSGSLSGTYGERSAWDARAELASNEVYAYGQRQHADWDDAEGTFEAENLFAKAQTRWGQAATLTLAAGSSRPEDDFYAVSQAAFAQDASRDRSGRASLDARLAETLSLHALGFWRSWRLAQASQEDGTYAPAGSLLQDLAFDERDRGVQASVVWGVPNHTVVAGVDYVQAELTESIDSGDYYQQVWGYPPHQNIDASVDRVGLYTNYTGTLGPFTLTPGIRHDRASKGGAFTSPSLGATWRLGKTTVVRGTLVRGFTQPALLDLVGAAHGFAPNPDLDPERVFSWQVGAETTAVPALWLKGSVFRHEVTRLMTQKTMEDGLIVTVNRGSAWRTGFQAEAETAAWKGLSARGGVAFVHVDATAADRDQDIYQGNLGLAFRAGTLTFQLLGHYTWWDLGPGAQEASHDDFLWDLHASKAFETPGSTRTELFASVRNLFNGAQMYDTDMGTEQRWVELGVRLRF